MTIRTALCLILVLAAAGRSAAQGGGGDGAGGIDLRPRFEKGQEMRYRMEIASNREILTGQPPRVDLQNQVIEQSLDLLLRVVDSPAGGENGAGGGATVELVLEGIKVSMSTPAGPFEFDSARPETDDGLLSPSIRPAVGMVLTLKLDADGNIVEVSGGEELTAVFGMTSRPGERAGSFLGPITSISRRAGPPARVGESWENVDVVGTGLIGAVKMRTRHTLERLEKDRAIVAIRGAGVPDTEAAQSRFTIADWTFEGAYEWNVAGARRGTLESLETTQTASYEGSFQGGPMRLKDRITTTVRASDGPARGPTGGKSR